MQQVGCKSATIPHQLLRLDKQNKLVGLSKHNMQHYFLTGILIVATLATSIKTVKDTEEDAFRFKIYEIIKKRQCSMEYCVQTQARKCKIKF